MTFAGRIEAQMTVPSAIAVSATNNGGGPTAVTLTPGTYYPTALLAQLAADLNATRPPLNYPLSAVAMNTAIGGYTWTAGYLCNDASGNATKAFGVVDMNPGGTPAYSLLGPRGGTDKAFGFTGSSDNFSLSNANFGGGVGATEDFAFFCVFKQPALTLGGQFVRVASNSTFGGGGGALNIQGDFTGGFMQWVVSDTVNAAIAQVALSAFTTGDYMVLGVVLDRSTNKIRIGVQSLVTGVQTIAAEVSSSSVGSLANVAAFVVGGRLGTESQGLIAAYYYAKGVGNCSGLSAGLPAALSNFANSVNAGWTATLSTGSSGTGKVTIGCVQAPSTATFALAWTSTALRDIVGFVSDIAASAGAVSGSKQCRGLFIPDAPLFADSDPKRAPLGSDERTTVSPSGDTYGFVGVPFYRHRNAFYTGLTRAKAWEAEAAIANSSWEFFYKETQLGLNSSWFTPKRKCQIYFDNLGTDTLVGIDANSGTGVAGWGIPKPVTLDELERVIPDYVGLLTLRLGDLFSSG